MQYKAKWDSFTVEQYDTMMDCNVKSTYLMIQKYAPAMKEKGWGRIVTVGSCNQYRQHPELSIYAVTKAAQMKMVQNFAPYLAPFGITINNVAPGAIATPRNAAIYEDDEKRRAVESSIPMGRFGQPEDCVGAVLLLCSDAGAYVTGSDIVMDGGLRL
jgi:NAD(P)-dependent dehydrogenase (short-subunit alcohol dehydrogenase family)